MLAMKPDEKRATFSRLEIKKALKFGEVSPEQSRK